MERAGRVAISHRPIDRPAVTRIDLSSISVDGNKPIRNPTKGAEMIAEHLIYDPDGMPPPSGDGHPDDHESPTPVWSVDREVELSRLVALTLEILGRNERGAER